MGMCMCVCVCRMPRGCRSWRLLDWEKNKGGARCSDTWVYPAAGLGQGPAVAAVGEVAGGEFAGGAGGVGGANAGPAGFAASAPHPMDPQPQETGELTRCRINLPACSCLTVATVAT